MNSPDTVQYNLRKCNVCTDTQYFPRRNGPCHTQSRNPRLLASRVPPQTFALAPPPRSKHKVCPPCPWLSPRVCLLAGVHHDRVPAAELARRPPVLQPHQQDAGAGQSVRGQAVAARHVHRQRQICLVPRCHRGEQVDPSAAQRSHFIQQPVRASRLLSSRDSYTDAKLLLAFFCKVVEFSS